MSITKKKIKPPKQDYLGKTEMPFRNRSLKNLPGERWKGIPGFEETHQVSNYGRCKALDREILYENGKVLKRKEQILLAGVCPAPNYIVQDYTYQLVLHIRMYNKVFNYTVARLVYHLFVEPLPDDSRILITQKDGDGLNCHYKNLLAVTSSGLLKTAFLKERHVSSFSTTDTTAARLKATIANFQPVSQYNLKGKRIRMYKSIVEAAAATGINKQSIAAAARGKYFTAGNFIWKHGKGPKEIDARKHLQKKEKIISERRNIKVAQYSLDGQLLHWHNSIKEASKLTAIRRSSIGLAARGMLKTAGGFIWKRSNR